MSNKSITIKYYALFREQSRKHYESMQISCNSAQDLYKNLCNKYGFTLKPDLVRVSINESYACMTSRINDGDSIVFIPPVAGG